MTKAAPKTDVAQTPPPSPSTLYGTDRLMTIPEMMALWSPAEATQGYIVIGEAWDLTKYRGPRFSPHEPRTWGRGGKAPLLSDPVSDDGAPHAARFGGTGAGKTSVIAADGCSYYGGMVFIDPKVELAPMLARARMEMDHDVIAMATERRHIEMLRGIKGLKVGGPNVLAHIPKNDPEEAEVQAKNATEWICGYTPEWSSTHSYFSAQGKDLVLCLAADMLSDPELPDEIRNLTNLRTMISDPALPQKLERIYLDSHSTVARSFAGELYPLSQKAEETWMSIYTTANQQTRWITFPRYARLVCGNEFLTDDLANGRTDPFLCLPLETLIAEPAIARCLIGSFIGAIRRADGKNDWIVFELDEARQLGRMKELDSLPHVGRGYRIKAIFHYQNINQPKRQFGEDALDELIDSCAWVSYMAMSSVKTTKHVEERLGTHGVIRWSQSEGTSKSGGQWWRSWSRSTNYSEESTPVKRASALASLPRNAQIVISGTGDKAITGVPYYFMRDRFTRMVDRNRFVRRDKESKDGRDRPETDPRRLLAAPHGDAPNGGSAATAGDAPGDVAATTVT